MGLFSENSYEKLTEIFPIPVGFINTSVDACSLEKQQKSQQHRICISEFLLRFDYLQQRTSRCWYGSMTTTPPVVAGVFALKCIPLLQFFSS